MKAVHEELKEIRLKKDISLKTISEKTKIRIDYLERLDEGDHAFTPMPYIRAFLREYAEMIGIDPSLVLLRLDNKINTLIPSETNTGTHEKPVQKQPEQPAVEPAQEKTQPDTVKTINETPSAEYQNIEVITETTNIVDSADKEKTPDVKEIAISAEATDKKPVTGNIDEGPKVIEQQAIKPEQPEKTHPLEIEEQKSYSALIFAIFIIIITIVALVIFFINKG